MPIQNGYLPDADNIKDFLGLIGTNQIQSALQGTCSGIQSYIANSSMSLIGSVNFNGTHTVFDNTHPTFTVYDDFSGTNLGNKWTSGATNGTITAGGGFAEIRLERTGALSCTGYICSSGNIFNESGGYLHIRLGSLQASSSDAGTDNCNYYIYVGSPNIQQVYAKSLTAPGEGGIAISGADIQLAIFGGSLYYRSSENSNNYGAWSSSTSFGDRRIVFRSDTDTGGGGGDHVLSLYDINFIKYISGINITSFTYSGTLIPRIQDDLPYNYAITKINGTTDLLSGEQLSISLNGGANYNTITNAGCIYTINSGSNICLQYNRSGTYGSSIDGGVKLTNFGILLN